MRRNVLDAIACLTAPGAAWLIGPWCARLEARRLWHQGRRGAAAELVLGAAVAPLFLGFVALHLPQLWTYALPSSAFHLWFLGRRQGAGTLPAGGAPLLAAAAGSGFPGLNDGAAGHAARELGDLPRRLPAPQA